MKIKSSLLGFAVAMSALAGMTGYRAMHPCANCPISMALGACGVGEAETAVVNVRFDEPKPGAAAPDKKDGQKPSEPEKKPEGEKKDPSAKPEDKSTEKPKVKTETAMFGAGCFWGVEATFRKQPGVVDAAVGYAGGKTKNPTYKDVCTDTTGHAEVVKIDFDPTKVTYEQLVQLFFKLHDPTQVNRQGPDFGSQYRTVIFFYSPEQEATARAVKDKLEKSGKYKKPIATQIEKAGEFYRAEEYHQRYLEKRNLDNCHLPPADE